MSVGKDGVGYNFDNGARAAIGDNGLTYKFNNGAEVHGKPTADGKLQIARSLDNVSVFPIRS